MLGCKTPYVIPQSREWECASDSENGARPGLVRRQCWEDAELSSALSLRLLKPDVVEDNVALSEVMEIVTLVRVHRQEGGVVTVRRHVERRRRRATADLSSVGEREEGGAMRGVHALGIITSIIRTVVIVLRRDGNARGPSGVWQRK